MVQRLGGGRSPIGLGAEIGVRLYRRHDIGEMVTYAFVRRYPRVTRGAMLLDVPIPGIEGWDEVQGDPSVWHVRFMQVPNLDRINRRPWPNSSSDMRLRSRNDERMRGRIIDD